MAQESAKTGRTVREIAREKKVIDRKFGVRGHVRALKAATCRRTPKRCKTRSMVAQLEGPQFSGSATDSRVTALSLWWWSFPRA
ncbi:MAG TPA: hypothetical protein VHU16_00655 [Candidatus Udaeobacter sp.]|nr:hypothetical protein [Candidatus Udaeobacter sp.]